MAQKQEQKIANASALIEQARNNRTMHLDLSGTGIVDLSPIAELTFLRSLDLTNCRQVTDLAALAGLTSLRSLKLNGCDQVTGLSPLAGLSALESLSLMECRGIADVAPLAGLSALQMLTFYDCPQLTDIVPLSRLTSLRALTLAMCRRLTDVSALARLSSLRSLNLMECFNLKDISPLAGLTSLQSLNLYYCSSLTDISPLAGLSSLKSLELGRCFQLTEIAPVAGFSSLQSLGLEILPLADLSPLIGLASLRWLSLRGVRADLAPLARLTSLETLDLAHIPLTDLTRIPRLTSLKSLDLRGSFQLTDLGPLAGFTSLEDITLNDCWNLTDISPLAGLSKLRSLSVLNSPVSGLPSWILSHPCLERFISNTLKGVPKELQSVDWNDNCLSRLRAWQKDRQFGEVLDSELKFFVLGNGGVGKTQLVRRLKGLPFDDSIPTTHGVQLVSLLPKADPLSVDAQVNIWDFGGQDIYHGTHSLFLKEDAVFLILWTPEMENVDLYGEKDRKVQHHPLAYWLEYVKQLAGAKSPVIVIQSQCENRTNERRFAAELLDGLVGARTIAFSARTDYGRGALLGVIRDAIRELKVQNPTPALGTGWVAVRDDLHRLLREERKRTLSRAEFDALCIGKGGVSDTAVLLEYLHRAGVVFHRDDLFNGKIILDQNWALDAIYALFDRNRCLPWLRADGSGTFTRADLALYVWDKAGFSVEEQELFLSMMESCGICFQWRKNAAGETIWLAPDLLPSRDDEPVRRLLQGRLRSSDLPCRTIRFLYSSLHSGIIRGLLSTVGKVAKDAAVYWRTGFYFHEESTDSYAVVNVAAKPTETEPFAREIELSVYGDRSDKLAAMLYGIIEGTNPKPHDTIDSKDSPCERLDTSDTANQFNKARIINSARTPRGAKPSIFISYAWGDETPSGQQRTAVVDGLCKKLTAEGIDVQIDKEKIRPGESIDAFMKQFGAADHVIPIISEKYLTSEYCMFELHSVWQASGNDPENFRQRVHPLVLDDAQIATPEKRGLWTMYWKKKQGELEELQQKLGVDMGDADFRMLKLRGKFKSEVADMLHWLNDILMPRGFANIQNDEYNSVLELVRQRS